MRQQPGGRFLRQQRDSGQRLAGLRWHLRGSHPSASLRDTYMACIFVVYCLDCCEGVGAAAVEHVAPCLPLMPICKAFNTSCCMQASTDLANDSILNQPNLRTLLVRPLSIWFRKLLAPAQA